MSNTRKQAERTPDQEPTVAEVAPVSEAEQVEQLKRCHDHPVNFPDESPLRPRGEFYGKGHHSYCKRCDGIRGKAHREARKAREGRYGADVAPFPMALLLREVQAQMEAEVPLDEAIEQTIQGLQESINAVRDALQQAFAPAEQTDEPVEQDAGETGS